MNLKRLRGIATVALITIAAALFAGCSNSMAGSVDGDSNARMATLSLSATGIPEEYAKEFAAYCEKQQRAAASRSILPDDPYDIGNIGTSGVGTQSENLVLVLTGKSETGMIYKDTDGTIGKVVTLKTTATTGVYDFDDTAGAITMESMSWNLCLTAYTDATRTKEVLVGYCSVDLRNGSGTAEFKMGIAGLTTPGSVTLEGDIVDKKDVSMFYTVGIYRKDNLKDAGGDTTPTEKTGELTPNSGANEHFVYSATNVLPGTYLYIMKFYTDSTKKKIVGSYTDTIVINPGNELTDDTLVIDAIEKIPTEPENLKAYLVKNSESSDGRTYNVRVTWKAAKYLTNYEMNVVELKETGVLNNLNAPGDGTAIADGTIYGMASMDNDTPKSVTDFAGSSVFGTNSSYMMYGDESCVLKLETGKVYEIQLRARNYVGVSKWVDRIAGTDATLGTPYAAPNDQKINRLLITYNLNGGTLDLSTGGSAKGTYVEYKSWTENDELLAIAPLTGTGNKLAVGTTDFDAWLLDDGTAVKDITDATSVTTTVGDAVKGYTYKNVSVKASFGNKVTGNIYQEDKIKDVERTDINLVYTLGSGVAVDPIPVNNGRYEVSKSTDGKSNTIKFTLSKVGTDLSVDGVEYTNVKFEYWTTNIDNKNTLTSSNGVCTIELDSFTGSVLNVMVIADTKNATGMSQTLTFELQ